MKKAINETGLLAIKNHYEKIYEIEDALFETSLTKDELYIHLSASPAVAHIKASGHSVAELYRETVATVNKTICKDTSFDVELLEYDEENGAYHLRFFRREK